jgi:DNA-binding CsgD family transcriptional regulator
MSFTRQLQSLGAELDDVLEQLGMPMWLVDASGVVRWQNAASVALVGDRRGQSGVAAVAPEYLNEARAISRKCEGDAEVDVVALDGHRTRLLASMAPVRDRDANVVGRVGVGYVRGAVAPTAPGRLTPRQHETLRLLAQGLSTDEIASRLGVTRETARNYIRRLLRSLGVRSRLEAVVRGRELGLI